jgi:hypothetical protein
MPAVLCRDGRFHGLSCASCRDVPGTADRPVRACLALAFDGLRCLGVMEGLWIGKPLPFPRSPSCVIEVHQVKMTRFSQGVKLRRCKENFPVKIAAICWRILE